MMTSILLPELWLEIFNFLPLPNVIRLTRTSASFYQFIVNNFRPTRYNLESETLHTKIISNYNLSAILNNVKILDLCFGAKLCIAHALQLWHNKKHKISHIFCANTQNGPFEIPESLECIYSEVSMLNFVVPARVRVMTAKSPVHELVAQGISKRYLAQFLERGIQLKQVLQLGIHKRYVESYSVQPAFEMICQTKDVELVVEFLSMVRTLAHAKEVLEYAINFNVSFEYFVLAFDRIKTVSNWQQLEIPIYETKRVDYKRILHLYEHGMEQKDNKHVMFALIRARKISGVELQVLQKLQSWRKPHEAAIITLKWTCRSLLCTAVEFGASSDFIKYLFANDKSFMEYKPDQWNVMHSLAVASGKQYGNEHVPKIVLDELARSKAPIAELGSVAVPFSKEIGYCGNMFNILSRHHCHVIAPVMKKLFETISNNVNRQL